MLEKRRIEEPNQIPIPFHHLDIDIHPDQLEKLELFRQRIRNMNLGGDAGKLTEEDMDLFERFEAGHLSLNEVRRHQDVLRPLYQPEVQASKKLLELMRSELEKDR